MSYIEIREAALGSWARLNFLAISGKGRLAPRLTLSFIASVQHDVNVQILDADVTITHKEEVIGEGRFVDVGLSDKGAVVVEVATSLPLLRYVTASLVPTATVVDLKVSIRGFARYTLRSERKETSLARQYAEVGHPKDFPIETSMQGLLQVERTKWYEEVLKPTHGLDLVYLEVSLPPVASPTADGWRQALANFARAEAAYVTGDDAAVFQHLRGAFDALPGGKQHLVDFVTNDTKRAALDGLLKKVGVVLHSGRHVDETGPQVGTFPVDHLDAGFALDLMRVVLAHLSQLFAAASIRNG